MTNKLFKALGFVAVSVLLIVCVAVALAYYKVKKTEWNVEELSDSIKVGDKLADKMSDRLFIDKTLPTGLSGVRFYDDKSEGDRRCLSVLSVGDGKISVYEEKLNGRVEMSVETFLDNMKKGSYKLGSCSIAAFTVMGGGIPYRGVLVVRYDKETVVTSIEKPFFGD